MTINIGNYQFEGPFTTVDLLLDQSGVYVILGRNAEGASWSIVDVGQSATVKTRISNHDRSDQWKRTGFKVFAVAVLYRDLGIRMRIESELRRHYNPPCGER